MESTIRAAATTSRADTATDPESVDPRIEYPCYKPFDSFIDVDRLRALDASLARGIRQHMSQSADDEFYTGPYTLDVRAPSRVGSRMIYLSRSTRPDAYFDLDDPEAWEPAPAAEQFGELMAFLATLPFASTGRMLIIYDDVARPGPAHRDHVETDVCHEFVWLRTNLHKRFYMLNPATVERRYVTSYSAWFDTVNQYHGSDACEGLSFSIRVDGVFTDAFRQRIPTPSRNRASAAALWASTERENA